MASTHTFYVHGMHCQACVLLTESELQEVTNVYSAKTTLTTRTVEVSGEFGDQTPAMIAEALSAVLTKHGYRLSTEQITSEKRWSEFLYAVPFALLFIGLFWLLQKAGLVNILGGDDVTYGTAFLVGIVASLSSCMAVVGGLVLSLSATFAKQGDPLKPQLLFHAGRMVSFFLLGGLLGAIGSAVSISATVTFVLSLFVAVVMFFLGLNLLDVFEGSKRFQLALPRFVSHRALAVTNFNHFLMPVVAGAITFFLPCGFTQSMQVYTLSTGNFLQGGLTMLTFALGTFPVLALISFSSYRVDQRRYKGVFFKTAGLIVILFAVFNLLNALAAEGIIRPLFTF